MQNEIDKSGRLEASKIGVLQCIWKHVIGTTVGLEPLCSLESITRRSTRGTEVFTETVVDEEEESEGESEDMGGR
jgi:hypothetical protein